MNFLKLLVPLFLLPVLHAAELVKPNMILIISDDHGCCDYGFPE